MPVTILKTVVFPAPFGPMIPVMLPSVTSKENESTALMPSKYLVSPFTENRGLSMVVMAAASPVLPSSF